MNEPTEPPPRQPRGRHNRNIALFVVLLGFIVLVYAVTIVKIKMGYGP